MKDKNQCKRLAPGLGWRCELRKGHIKKANEEGAIFPLHHSAFVKWSDEEGTVYQNSAFTTHIPQAGTYEVQMECAMAAVDPAEQELRDWWQNQANDEIEGTVAKAIEYGATDLIDIGVMLARTMRRPVGEEEAAELGVFFYVIGKIARWQSAIERGDRVSNDTLFDIGVYIRMAQRIRDAGGWPGKASE